MAALAVDAFGKVAAKNGLGARRVVPGWNLRVSIVAKNALVGHEPPRDRMPRIESGAHRPVAALFRVPAERQLDECSASSALEIGTGVVTRTKDVVDPGLLDVSFFPAETDLPAPLVISAVANNHRVMRVRERMVILVGLGIVFDRIRDRGPK